MAMLFHQALQTLPEAAIPPTWDDWPPEPTQPAAFPDPTPKRTRALTVAVVAAVPLGRWWAISVKLPFPVPVARRPVAPRVAVPISVNTAVIGSSNTASIALPVTFRAPIAPAVLAPTVSARAIPVGLAVLRRACGRAGLPIFG